MFTTFVNWQRIGIIMNILDVVNKNLARLHSVMGMIGVDNKPKIFHEWASGRVLLDARALLTIMNVIDCDYSVALLLVEEAFQTSSERILVPTLGRVNGEFVIYLVYPRS